MSTESEANIPFVDADRMQTISNACESFEEIPPEMAEIAANNEALSYIAENIHAICSNADTIKISSDDKKTLEFAFRTFAFQSKGGKVNEGDEREQNNMIKQLTQQLADAREQLRIAEEELEGSKEQNKTLQKRIESATEENKEYFDRLTQSEAKITAIRRENSQSQNKLKSEIEQLKDEVQEMKDKLKMSEFSVKRLTTSLNNAGEEASQAQAELVTLRSKAQSRAQKVKDAKNEVTKMQLHLQEVETENQQLLTEQDSLINQLKSAQEELLAAAPENMKNLEDENEKYARLVENLQTFTAQQAEDIEKMRQEQKEATELLHQHISLVNAYDARYESLSSDYENAVSQNEALTRNIEDLNQQLEEAKAEAERVPSKFKTRDIGNFDEENFEEEEDTREELREQNRRLIEIIENQLRFLQSAVVRQVMDCAMLSPDTMSDPLLQDSQTRDRMLIEITRTRQFIASNNLGGSEMKDKEIKQQVSELDDAGNMKKREAFAVIALQAENSELIRKFCDKINSKYQLLLSQLNAAAEVINYKGNQDDLGITIAENLRTFQTFAKKAQLIINGEFDPTNFDETLSSLTKYLQTSSAILKQCDTDLRSAVKFEGDLIDLPFFAVECVNDLLKMVANAKEQSVQDMRAQIEQLQLEQEEEKEKASEAIAALEAENKHKEEIINGIQSELEQSEKKNVELANENRDISVQRQEAEDKLQKMLSNYNDIEADMEAAKEETERIREQMNKKQKAFEERLDAMIEEERQQHSDDLKRFEEKLKQREDKLKAELESKSKKLHDAKAKLREVIETYDSAFRQQKETTSVLRQQNQELIDRLQQRHEQKNREVTRSVQSAEVEQLKADIRQLTSDKSMLENKLEQTIANAEQARSIRESYWESQLSQKEDVISRSIQIEQDESETKIKDLVTKIAHALAPYVSNDVDAETVVEEAANVSQKIATMETEIQKLKTRKVVQPSGPGRLTDIHRIQQLTTALQEWDRWGRDLYVSVTEGQVPCQSTKDLRYQLGEMILSSIGHRQLIWRLECLRAQKKALTCGVEIPQKSDEEKPVSARVLSTYILAAIRLMHKSGHYQTLFD